SCPPPLPISTLFPYTTLFRSIHSLQDTRWTDANVSQSGQGGVGGLARPSLALRLVECMSVPSKQSCRSDRCGAVIGQLVSSLGRSEEHTSELQSRRELVCRLL